MASVSFSYGKVDCTQYSANMLTRQDYLYGMHRKAEVNVDKQSMEVQMLSAPQRP